MKKIVLDSYALISYLDQEEGWKDVSALFDECVAHDERALMCVVNWGEVFYIALRAGGEKMATLALDTMRALPLEIVEVDQELTLQAARYKAHNKMSYADAFAAALAKKRNAELATGDKEFEPLSREIKIKWIK